VRLAGLVVLVAGCGFSTPASVGDGSIDTRTADAAPPARKIVFANAAVTENLDDFPVLIPIAGQIDYAQVLDPRKDLRFEDAAHTALAYEVETWNPNGESLVWVRVPRIVPGPAQSSIFVFVGRDVETADPHGVWSAYEQVNHFAANANDSTAQAHDGTAAGGAVMTSGYLGNAATFAAGADKVTFAGASFDSWSAGTIEMWIKPNYPTALDVPQDIRVVDNGSSLEIGRFFPQSPLVAFQIDFHWSGGAATYLHPNLAVNTWSYVAWAYDGQYQRVYKNGLPASSSTIGSDTFASSSGMLVLGGGAHMQVDELRVSKQGLTPSWIAAQQLSMTRSFVTFTDP
jgi:hypothetical protein